MTDHVADGPIETVSEPWAANPQAPGQQRSARSLDLPSRRLFWAWVWQSVRPIVGWVLAALGALALFLGWYGVSGQALTAKQIPYLVSGGLVGIALMIMSAAFLATEDWRRQIKRLDVLERKVDDLLALLTTDLPLDLTVPDDAGEPAPVAVQRSPASSRAALPVAVPSGTVYHRPACQLVAGKATAVPVDAAEIRERGLSPCRVCDPAPPPAA